MGNLKDQIKDRIKELENPSDMYSPALQLTLPPLFNASRKIIYGHNMSHVVNIEEPDFPHVYTGFEKIYGEYSEMFEKAESKMEVYKKFKRNKYHYLLVVYDIENDTFDIVERKPYEQFFENYATKYNNDYLDSLKEGDVIPKGKTYIKSTSFDENDLHRVGKELNTLYMISTETEEDCITLMNGAEKMMDNFKVYEVDVNIPLDSTVLLNLYGDSKGKDYKPFPMVGEKIKNGILLAMRRVSTSSIFFDGKDKYTNMITQGDIIKYVKGRVIDITCYCNEDIRRIPNSLTYAPIKGILKEQTDFYMDLYEELDALIKGGDIEGYKIGRNLHYWRNRARTFIESSTFFAVNNDPIKNLKLVFTIVERNSLVPGSKLSGYFGNKGVVGNIYASKDSYFTVSGKPIHAITNVLGVSGRINTGQLSVHFKNYVSETVILQMIEMQEKDPINFHKLATDYLSGKVIEIMESKKLTKERFEILRKYFEILDTPDKDYIVEYFNGLSDKQKDTFIANVMRNGIYVLQDPNDPSDITNCIEASEKFDIRGEYIQLPNGCFGIRRAIVSKLPFIRLKQDPIDKFSVRGKSNIEPMTHLPSKSYNKKQFLEPYADTAVQFGTFETYNLSMCKRPEAISLFYALLSNSPDAKDKIRELYNKRLDDEFMEEFSKIVFSSSRKNREVIEAKLYPLGIKMIIEMDDGSIG